MREHLIGYLIGALEPEEHAAVEQALAGDETLRADLRHLDSSLGVLQETHGQNEVEALAAPPGLAMRTCERIARRARAAVTPASMTAIPDAAASARGWSMLDYGVAAAVLIAGGMLVLPAISQSRFHSRLLACQDNLRQVGRALEQYSDSRSGSFPVVNTGDVVGRYGPELLESSCLEDSRSLICPNSPDYETGWRKLPTQVRLVDPRSPEIAEYREALRPAYGYTVGYVDKGKHLTRRNERDANYALVADAPSKEHDYARSLNHGGCGQNVLFEDGHVRYLNGCHYGEDHIFKNDLDKIGPGANRNDAVIIPADHVLE
ncbi:MAG: hypothetical protein WEA31_03500 [Pirellulales bacterium]